MYNLLLMAIIAALSQSSASNRDGIPGSDLPTKIRSGNSISFTSAYFEARERAIANYAQGVKRKITPTLRDKVPCELFITSGFIPDDQDNLYMAGCYIRLGSSIRSSDEIPNNLSLSSIAFMNSGTFYVTESLITEDNTMRLDFLLSAAQCYHWSFCNESNPIKKQTIKNISLKYYERVRDDLGLVDDAELRTIWRNKIDNNILNILGCH